jgi:glycosyltransferase involved in cell wall biosynthesis
MTTRRLLGPAVDGLVEPGPVPTFSIVIPAYQAARSIGEAVASALTQTLPPHEVIVCDDGSTDDVASVLKPFLDRIVLLRRPHRGAGAARNTAVRAASGDFVVMLDADDVYDRERLRALGELAAARPDLDILGTDAYYERAGYVERRLYESIEFAVERQRTKIIEYCFIAWPALRRARVLEIGGFDESPAIAPAEDWDLFLRLILGGSRAGIVAEPLMRYRRHPASATADRARALWSRVAVLEKARHHEALAREERSHLERCLSRARSAAVLNDARHLAASPTADSRRSLLRLAKATGLGAGTRATLAAAAVAPPLSERLIGWNERWVARSLR